MYDIKKPKMDTGLDETANHEQRIIIRFKVKRPHFPRLASKFKRWLRPLHRSWVRGALIAAAALIIGSQLMTFLQPYLVQHSYALGSAESLLEPIDKRLSSKLEHTAAGAEFDFNADYTPLTGTNPASGGGPKISAKAYEDPAKGLIITDPINQTSFTITPKFKLLDGRQDGNRLVYPMANGNGWLVYTMQVEGVKEDLVLDHAKDDTLKLSYELKLGDSFNARVAADGSVGIYGSDSFLVGSVTTGSDKDAELLQKARQNASKTKLFFSLPAPVVYEAGGAISRAQASYSLEGNQLETVVTKLKNGRFPLTIDPTVTVTSVSDLFRDTNPESNADFNGGTGNISRGTVTGGVIPAWTSNANNLATARFLHGATIYDDYAYVAGGAGSNSTSNLTSIEFARLSAAGSSIGAWSTTTSLPTALSRFTLLAYNGYLYAIGGSTTNTSCGTDSNLVYYNRIQVNGQLSANWITNSSSLPSAVCGLGAAAYNGRLYVAGGRTGSATNTGITTVAYATINPDGSVSSFTTDDSTLPAARFDGDLRLYNGYAYIIGGNLNGTLTNTVAYAPIAGDGSLYGGAGSGSWKSASTFGTARSNLGSSFTATNDGFMYVEGGCSAYTSDSCTSIRNEIQVAQINADGSLGPWSDVDTAIAALSRVGASLFLWRGTIYSLAGCTSMNAGAVSCASGSTQTTQSYSSISSPGQVGPVNNTTNLPTAVWAHGSVVNNGFIYIVGGCITISCQAGSDTTGQTSYAALNADGTIGSWTTDTTHILNSAGIGGETGLAAFGLAVYNNSLFATGGYTSGGPSRNVYYVQLNANGSLAANWTVQSNKLGATTYYNSAVAYHAFLFVFGGCIGTTGSSGCSTYRNTNYRMPISAGVPGTLTTSAGTGNFLNLPTATGLMAPATYNGYIYLAGGANGSTGQTDTVFYARIADNGDITSWSTATGHLAHTLRRADAVAMNGYLYVFGGHDGNGPTTYGDIEIGKLNLSTGNIDANFTNSVIQITPRWDERAVFSNGYMYASGGCANGNPPASCASGGISVAVQYVELFNAGNKGASTWSNSSNVYTTNRVGGVAAAYNGYLYVAGGCSAFTVGASFGNTTTQCTTPATSVLNSVAYAPINPDGSLGSWTTGSNNLTASNGRAFGCLMPQAGYLYYVGGETTSGVATATVLYSQIGGGGVPGAWSQATNGLPDARRSLSCDVFSDRIYATGGIDASNADQASVYYSPNLSAGGDISAAWSTGTAFTAPRANHTSIVAAGYLYVMGGDDGTSARIDVQFIQLDPTAGGTTGSWATSPDLPQAVSYQSVTAANGYIYLYGGRTTATNCINNTYIASVNSTGRLSNWSQALNNFTTARFGAASYFYNGYYYVLGGDDCTNVMSSNVIQYGGQQSQAMKTLISKYADFAADGKPYNFVGYLTNAVNNGVDIEKWRLIYRSSTEATNSWGVTSTISPLNDEAVNTVAALDGSGADVKLARWVWLTFDINMEQSFSFQDANQPTISQYELYYSPPPSKRLMHGKDFRDQTQQDLDAHP